MCNSSIGINIETNDCDDMTDEEAIEIFQNEGWFLDPKTMTKLCPKCKEKIKKIADKVQ
jgi:lysozyme family protein